MRPNMQWLERILGVSEYRRYGEHEYYEYPRSGGYGSSGGSGSWELERDNSWSWRGPSIFEVPFNHNDGLVNIFLVEAFSLRNRIGDLFRHSSFLI